MFCTKCGRNIPDGTVCPCQQQNSQQQQYQAPQQNSYQQYQQAPQSNPLANFDIMTIITLGVAILSFIFLYIAWFKLSYPTGYNWYTGEYSSTISYRYSIFSGWGFASSFFIGFAKIIGWFTVVAFIAHIASTFVDLKKFVPQLGNFDIKKLSQLAYYGLYALALVFCLLGVITTDFGIGWGWFFALIFCGAGVILTIKPDLVKNIINK